MEQIDRLPREPDVQIHLVMDPYGTHKTPRWRRGFASRPYYPLHFTPTGASWLNLVARFFSKITPERIRRGAFRSVPHMEREIRAYLAEQNRDPRPFVWSAPADLILEKVAAVCKRTYNSGH